MKGFLEEVAADLYARYGEGLSERAVLFPSRRARLFFVDALGRIAGRPMWQPEWVTIDDLTGEISGLHTGDRVRLITELYKVYSAYHNEPFDKFYFWGDMLLTDFDTIDKYLIDAQMLFRNISEIKEIEADISYLTPAQLRILSFWSSFGEQADLSEEKRRFLAIWKTLGPIYRRFRERLSSLGIAYNGMVQRAAADRIRGGGFAFPEPRRYVVAGFNALSECEKRLFGFLATAAETDFYWDYDSYYKDDPEQEAGMFVRSNVAQFPPRTELRYDNMRGEKQIVSVAAVSNACSASMPPSCWPSCSPNGAAPKAPMPRLGRETAVVLTDENLLLPLLYGPAGGDRTRERHDGLPAAGEPGLHLCRAPRGAAGAPPPQGRRLELLPQRRGGAAGPSLRRGERCRADPLPAGGDRARTPHLGRCRVARAERPAAAALHPGRGVARAVGLPAAVRRRRGPASLRGGRRPAAGRVSGRALRGDHQAAQLARCVRRRADNGGLHLAAAPPPADRPHPLRGRTARGHSDHGYPRDAQPRLRARAAALDERRQLPRQPHGTGVVRPLQPACGLLAAHARAPRRGLRLLFLPPDPARVGCPDALLRPCRRQVHGRAEPLHPPDRLRERSARCAGRGRRRREPRRDGPPSRWRRMPP